MTGGFGVNRQCKPCHILRQHLLVLRAVCCAVMLCSGERLRYCTAHVLDCPNLHGAGAKWQHHPSWCTTGSAGPLDVRYGQGTRQLRQDPLRQRWGRFCVHATSALASAWQVLPRVTQVKHFT
eukprot:1138014-Pelagomonas_calceolata.AAC.7